jgi:GDP-D-mannose dehydratase
MQQIPQQERVKLDPRSPHAAIKDSAVKWIAMNCREAYSKGSMFNRKSHS